MFDVLVIGGGHAGVEAATASARRGARTALIAFDPSRIGALSCNPAIGGVGKGHIVREVDAFDGVMARAADAAAIHHRMLNRSKGVAVHGPRVQADRMRYAAAIADAVKAAGVTVIAGEAASLRLRGGRAAGVDLADGTALEATAVVVATGTFLGATLFRGEQRRTGGRVDEAGAQRLADQFRGLGLPMGRLKTGTPPRLDGRSIDWARLEEQPSDRDDWTFSPLTANRRLPQVACAITRTRQVTHDIIRAALDRSPLFTGAIAAEGPRYCPSIEDKIHRFGDRDGHQLFLEPEGLDDAVIYPNGFSTSLPADVQQAAIRSIEGLEAARIVVPGYAVEYDYFDPRALDRRLALDAIPGLFCAGQINGTTGYEEAAGQGLVAGLNAAAHALGLAPAILDRSSSYIGVMIDDLVLQGVSEPYRMLTARAEFRLSLRADNAETRLGPVAEALGCLGERRLQWQRRREQQRSCFRDRLDASHVDASTLARQGLEVSQDGSRRSAWQWLRSPDLPLAAVASDADNGIDADIVAEILHNARYEPYLDRQRRDAAAMHADEAIALDAALDYAAIPGLSAEMIDRLQRARPRTLAEASRVRGVTPAALSALLLNQRRRAA